MLTPWVYDQVVRAIKQYNLQSPVLDIGVGDCSNDIRNLFDSSGLRYWSLDKDPHPNVNFIATVPRERLPMIKNLETAMILSMLENTFVPNSVVRWAINKLSQGGRLLICVPVVKDAPGLWRFMPDGVQWLLRETKILEITQENPTLTENGFIFAVAEKQ